ncbi:MAG: hypothetical protein WC350_05970 [Candidatus Micrarchaeia archaeon]|jgi:hypothetical protein
MKSIIAILSLLSLGFSCYNLTDYNGTFEIPQNETCFWIDALNATYLHNNTLIIENITANCTNETIYVNITEYVPIQYNTSLLLDPSQCYVNAGANESICARNETLIYLNYTANITQVSPMQYNTSELLEQGQCYINANANETTCAQNYTTVNNTIDTCPIPWTIKQFDIVPGEMLTVAECKAVFNCGDAPAEGVNITQPDWLRSCSSPAFGWGCMDWLYENCEESEQQTQDYAECHERLREQDVGEISSLQSENEGLNSQIEWKDGEISRLGQNITGLQAENEQIRAGGWAFMQPLLILAGVIMIGYTVFKNTNFGRVAATPNPNGKPREAEKAGLQDRMSRFDFTKKEKVK